MEIMAEDYDYEAKVALEFILDLVEVAAPFAEPDEEDEEDEDAAVSSSERNKTSTSQMNIDDERDDTGTSRKEETTKDKEKMTNGHVSGNDSDIEEVHSSGDSMKEKATSKDKEETGLVVRPGLDVIQAVIRDFNPKTCVVCGSPKVSYQAVRGMKIEKICSQECLVVYKKVRSSPPCLQCKKAIDPGSFAFKPNYGLISGNVCSEECLLMYEVSKIPKGRCINSMCLKPIGPDRTFHWQTMDFCSEKCVNDVMIKVGAKCAQCRANVAFNSIGKYSVRFGEVVRQFCNINCLQQYKKSIRSCFFCQSEVGPQSLTSQSRNPVDRDFGEGVKSFCNMRCLDDFTKYDALKKIRRETATTPELKSGDFCDICSCFHETDNPDNVSIDHISFKDGDEHIFLCSNVCAAAYRFKRGNNSLFCYYCFQLDWNLSEGVLLRFGCNCRVFCSRRCMTLFIMKIRKLVNCHCCKCCKYQFDLIEEAGEEGSSRYYCSLVCLNLVQESRLIKKKYESQLDVIKCCSCLKITKGHLHIKAASTSEPNNTTIRSFCTHSCYNNYRKAEMQQQLQQAQQKQQQQLQQQRQQQTREREQQYQRARELSRTGEPLRPIRPQSNVSQTTTRSSALMSMLNSNSSSTPVTCTRSLQSSTPITLQVQNKSPVLTTTARPTGQITASQMLQNVVNHVTLEARQHPVPILPATLAPQTKEVIVVKEAPKKMINAAVQCRKGMVTKAVMCKPHLVDAGVQTDPM